MRFYNVMEVSDRAGFAAIPERDVCHVGCTETSLYSRVNSQFSNGLIGQDEGMVRDSNENLF